MSTVLNIAAANWSRSEIGILLHRQEEEIKRLKAELEEMTARAVSLALHLPPETLAGDVQRWRDEAKLLLANDELRDRSGSGTPTQDQPS